MNAAIAEGIPLASVLEQEQIDPGAWPAIERGYREAIAASSASQLAFSRARRIAMDCLVRTITPLEDDAALVGHKAPRAIDPDETMAPFLAAGPALPFRTDAPAAVPLPAPLADASGETLAIPDPRASEPGPSAESGEATLPFDPNGWLSLLKVDRYAEMAAQLRAEPSRADAIMREFGLETAERRTKMHNIWKLRFEANTALRLVFDRLVDEKLGKPPADDA